MLLATLALATLADPSPKVGLVHLAALANGADVIVVGRVSEVVCIGPEGIVSAEAGSDEAARCDKGKAVAQIEVERVVRGGPGAKRFWYLAEGTWTCDVAQAIPGERALFFLSQGEPVFALDPAADVASRHTGGQPILRDAYSGRGRMPLRKIDGEEWLTAWLDVVTPDALEKRSATWEGKYESIYWSARLDDVVDYVERELRTQDFPLPAHPDTGAPAKVAVMEESRVVAAFWGDGTAIWSGNEQRGGPPYLQGAVAPDRVSEISGWCYKNAALLPAFPPRWDELPNGASRAYVTVRYTRTLYDIALEGPKRVSAHELRDLVLERLPEDGSPLSSGALVVR